MKKKFVTIFPAAENVHLTKDVGMIPYIMFRDFGYDSTLVCFKNGEYPSLKENVQGLKLYFLQGDPQKYSIRKISSKVLSYIWRFGKKIDVLNLYHITYETICYAIMYKLIHRKGLIYIKLDLSIKGYLGRKKRFSISQYFIYKWFFKNTVDISSYEVCEAEAVLKSDIPTIKNKLLHIPNCFDDRNNKLNKLKLKLPQDKDNIILTVGRIGTYQKNSEFFLNALKRVDIKNWKVFFVGPIEHSFLHYIDDFMNQNLSLKDKIVFTGNITNKLDLYALYNKAKIFCLTSRSEAFPLVWSEALYFGNYIISTEVSSINDIIISHKIGRIINTEIELSNLIKDIIDEKINISSFYYDIIEHSRNFLWTKSLQSLDIEICRLLCDT